MQWTTLLAELSQRFIDFMGAVYTQDDEKFIGMDNPDGFNHGSRSVYDHYTIEGRVEGISEDQNDHRRELLKRIDPKIGDAYYFRDIFTDAEFRSSTSCKTVMEPAGIGHWVSLKFAECGPHEAEVCALVMRGLHEALSFFKTVAAMFNVNDQHMCAIKRNALN